MKQANLATLLMHQRGTYLVVMSSATRSGRGRKLVVTDQLRRELRAWLAVPGHTQDGIAKAVGCRQSYISALINKPERTQTSEYVESLCSALGLPIPTESTPPSDDMTEDDRLLAQRFHDLRESDPEAHRYWMIRFGLATPEDYKP